MATFLLLNGVELVAAVDDAEETMLALAAGALPREQFTDWVVQHTVRRRASSHESAT